MRRDSSESGARRLRALCAAACIASSGKGAVEPERRQGCVAEASPPPPAIIPCPLTPSKSKKESLAEVTKRLPAVNRVHRSPPSPQVAPLRDAAAAHPRAALPVSASAGTMLPGMAPRAPLHLRGGGVAAGVPIAAVLVAMAVAALGSAWLLRRLPGRAEHCGSAGAPPPSIPPPPFPCCRFSPITHVNIFSSGVWPLTRDH